MGGISVSDSDELTSQIEVDDGVILDKIVSDSNSTGVACRNSVYIRSVPAVSKQSTGRSPTDQQSGAESLVKQGEEREMGEKNPKSDADADDISGKEKPKKDEGVLPRML